MLWSVYRHATERLKEGLNEGAVSLEKEQKNGVHALVHTKNACLLHGMTTTFVTQYRMRMTDVPQNDPYISRRQACNPLAFWQP